MNKVTLVGNTLSFRCPGCKLFHSVNVNTAGGWTFNGDLENPTLNPSILARVGHYATHFTPEVGCWCDYNREHPEDYTPGFECSICHSFVRDGKIEFLADSTHELAGQTVELLDTAKA